MKRGFFSLAVFALSAGLAVSSASAQQWHGGDHRGNGHANPQAHPAEPERGPQGYNRMDRPSGTEARPQQFDRHAYNHNFSADRGYHIGPYHAPRGFAYRRWSYGQVLPRYYWGQQYWLNEYWLFGLDVPPVGLEWVRYGPDALLIDTRTGEVVQVVYGRFF